MQFFAGVIFFAIIVNFIPEPTISPGSDVKDKKVGSCKILDYDIFLLVILFKKDD